MNEVIKTYDITIVCGYRGEAEQNKAYLLGKSKLKFPKSAHNKRPAIAVDVYPYPVSFKDPKHIEKFKEMRSVVHATAERLYSEEKMTHKLRKIINLGSILRPRWDFPHFELLGV
jgi:peptidoglycan L-alanyl-D-glutamate endopeptidase CwlK